MPEGSTGKYNLHAKREEKKKKTITKKTLPCKIYHSEVKEKEFPREAEAKGVHHH